MLLTGSDADGLAYVAKDIALVSSGFAPSRTVLKAHRCSRNGPVRCPLLALHISNELCVHTFS